MFPAARCATLGMVMTADAAVCIDRRAEEVFAALGAAGGEATWHVGVLGDGDGDGHDGGHATARVTCVHPGRLLEMETAAGGVRQAITYQLQEDEAGATRCRRAVVVEAGLSPGEERALRPHLQAANQARLEALKVAMEAGEAAAGSTAGAGTAGAGERAWARG